MVGHRSDPYLLDDINNRQLLKTYARDLPIGLITAINELAEESAAPVLTVKGFGQPHWQADTQTPRHWKDKSVAKGVREFEIFQAMVAECLGPTYTMPTTQCGHLVHELFPMPEHASYQFGTGTIDLALHTEDAFDEACPDFLVLAGVRNNDAVATGMSVPVWQEFTKEDLDELRKPEFRFRPDESHAMHSEIDSAIANIKDLTLSPKKLPLVFGREESPHLRFDEHFMLEVINPIQKASYQRLKQHVAKKRQSIVLAAGDLLLFDNRRAIHGREKISASYDGSDRWIRRVFVKKRGTKHEF